MTSLTFICCYTILGSMFHIFQILLFLNCPTSENTTFFWIYITYFHDEKRCGKFDSNKLFEKQQEPNRTLEFPAKAKWYTANFAVFGVTAVFDFMWLLLSIVPLVKRISDFVVSEKKHMLNYRVMWSSVGILLCVFDVYCLIVFLVHFCQILNSSVGWMKVCGVKNVELYADVEVPKLRVLAPIVLTLYSVRWALGFVLNVEYIRQMAMKNLMEKERQPQVNQTDSRKI